MTHTEIRDALTDGRSDADVVAHLASCTSCRSFATALEHILETAPRLAGSPPTDLADRVLVGIDLDTHGLGSPPARDDDSAFLPAFWAGAGRRLTAVAAALLLVVGLTAVLQRTDEADPREVVLASAERTTAAGSARVEVGAEAEVVVDLPETPAGEVPSGPDLSHVPVEMHAHVQREWARIMADFEVQLRPSRTTALRGHGTRPRRACRHPCRPG